MSIQGHSCRQPLLGIDASQANLPRRTGVEWYAHNVIQGLKSVVPSSVRVVLYSNVPLRDELADLPPNWESRVLRWPFSRGWLQFRMSWEMWRWPPDLLFSPAYVLPPIMPRRGVMTVHDVGFAAVPWAYGWRERLWQKWSTRRNCRRAAAIITVSEFSKSEIVRFFSVAAERVHVTPLAVRSERYLTSSDDADVLRRYGLHGPYFLFVGRLETKKNVAGLFSAFVEFKKRDASGHTLVLVGPNADSYPRFLSRSATPPIIPLGYVCPDDLPTIYRGATALALPSHYEGFGLPVLEAFAAGVPAVVGGGSLPEIAGGGALVVDPKDGDQITDAMRRLATDADLRADLVAKGRARLADYSWEKTARLTWETLRQFLGGKCG